MSSEPKPSQEPDKASVENAFPGEAFSFIFSPEGQPPASAAIAATAATAASAAGAAVGGSALPDAKQRPDRKQAVPVKRKMGKPVKEPETGEDGDALINISDIGQYRHHKRLDGNTKCPQPSTWRHYNLAMVSYLYADHTYEIAVVSVRDPDQCWAKINFIDTPDLPYAMFVKGMDQWYKKQDAKDAKNDRSSTDMVARPIFQVRQKQFTIRVECSLAGKVIHSYRWDLYPANTGRDILQQYLAEDAKRSASMPTMMRIFTTAVDAYGKKKEGADMDPADIVRLFS